jgi:hypothetical protein
LHITVLCRDYGPIVDGKKPVWHLNVPSQEDRAAWLVAEAQRERESSKKPENNNTKKNLCGFCNVSFCLLYQ